MSEKVSDESEKKQTGEKRPMVEAAKSKDVKR
jgi:hypothetical protein